MQILCTVREFRPEVSAHVHVRKRVAVDERISVVLQTTTHYVLEALCLLGSLSSSPSYC